MVIVSQLQVPEAGLVYQSLNVLLKIDQTRLPAGALYITEKYVVCKSIYKNTIQISVFLIF